MPGDLRFESGVSFEHTLMVFGDPLGGITDNPRHGEDEERSALLGRPKRRRLLMVMFTERGEAIRLINARDGDAE